MMRRLVLAALALGLACAVVPPLLIDSPIAPIVAAQAQTTCNAGLAENDLLNEFRGGQPNKSITTGAIRDFICSVYASIISAQNGLVSIKTFGATGNGSTDDTSGIQSAIDFAYNNHIQGIFCPSGAYKISGGGNAIVYLDPPGNLRSSWVTPSNFSFSLAFVGQDQGLGNNSGSGCILKPTTATNVAFIVGPGQHMAVRNISVVGPAQSGSTNYRGNLPGGGIGIGIAGSNGGASVTLIEGTDVENFYAAYETGANGNGSLADSNTFLKVDAFNCFYGVNFSQSQNDINEIISSRLTCNTDIWNGLSRQVTVIGGNLSPDTGVSASFGVSGTSAFSKTADGNGFDYTFTTVIASPDGYIPNVYNSFTMVTSHFGVVPITMTNWVAGTSTATFQIVPSWVLGNFGTNSPFNDLTTGTDLQAEIAAVTKVYAAERTIAALGPGISIDGAHFENGNTCETTYFASQGFSGTHTASLRNLYFNEDPAKTAWAPVFSPTDAHLAIFYCNQVFPLIAQAQNGALDKLDIDGGSFGQTSCFTSVTNPCAPILFEQTAARFLTTHRLTDLLTLNMLVGTDSAFTAGAFGSLDQLETVSDGAGEWDGPLFLPHALDAFTAAGQILRFGSMRGPYNGYHLAYGTNIPPSIYSTVSGVLGALGSYPPIDCNTLYRSIEFNSGAIATGNIQVRSASCPGYSWGQNLVDALVGETVTWSYKGGSPFLYLSPKALSWMFPGLGITLAGGTGDGSSGADTYIVTAVYPHLGYITAIDITHSKPLPGTKTTIYSCASSCTIGQAAYSWTKY